jgi:fluoride exporter
MIHHFFLVGLGGAIGSMLRYGAGLISIKFLGFTFPWGTLLINILGSFLIGIVFAIAGQIQNFPENIKIFMMVGILGGFTTFSAFSLDSLLLLEKGNVGQALIYIIGSVVLSITATFIGLMLVKASPI